MATAAITGTMMVAAGHPGEVHTEAKNNVGTVAYGNDTTGNSALYIYLKGVASTIVGSVVTYDELGQTALIAANAKGPVAVATAITVANTWGWYGRVGAFLTDVVANSADNSTIGRETTDGKVGDGRAAGDEILGAVQRAATTAAAVVLVQYDRPFVNDFEGA